MITEVPMPRTPAILFVCLGNICRSPLAEGAMRAVAEREGIECLIDSAGTGPWHIGDAPDPRAQRVARRHGVEIGDLRGRQVSADDFERFSHIVALDKQNLAALQKVRPTGSRAELKLLLDYVPGMAGKAVADPYYGDENDFEKTWSVVSLGAEALVALLKSA